MTSTFTFELDQPIRDQEGLKSKVLTLLGCIEAPLVELYNIDWLWINNIRVSGSGYNATIEVYGTHNCLMLSQDFKHTDEGIGWVFADQRTPWNPDGRNVEDIFYECFRQVESSLQRGEVEDLVNLPCYKYANKFYYSLFGLMCAM